MQPGSIKFCAFAKLQRSGPAKLRFVLTHLFPKWRLRAGYRQGKFKNEPPVQEDFPWPSANMLRGKKEDSCGSKA